MARKRRKKAGLSFEELVERYGLRAAVSMRGGEVISVDLLGGRVVLVELQIGTRLALVGDPHGRKSERRIYEEIGALLAEHKSKMIAARKRKHKEELLSVSEESNDGQTQENAS